ncbi:MAG: hypothetical protein ACI4PO_03765 [Faecousia sp.]
MKKIFAIMFAMLIVMAVTIPAHAATQALPKIPDVEVHVEIPQSFWDKWFEDHPIVIPKPADPTEPETTEPAETEPEITAPELTELGVPEITNAHYTHSRAIYAPSNLKIAWTEVEDAESYEVLITLANGETLTYVETDTSVYDTSVKCPQSYSGENGHIAYVKVRAVAGDVYGEWSAEDTIGCNALHFGG